MLTYYVSGNTIISYSYVPASHSSEGLITAQDCNFDARTENAKEYLKMCSPSVLQVK
jgi:hypothetical protein